LQQQSEDEEWAGEWEVKAAMLATVRNEQEGGGTQDRRDERA